MTAAVNELASLSRNQTGGLPDPVGLQLERVARDLGMSCLLESSTGRVISHAVVSAVPPCVVSAVVHRDAACLHQARGPVLQAGVIRSGPVLHTSVEGWPGAVTVLPIPGHGWLWVLGQQPLTLKACEEQAAALHQTLNRAVTQATDEVLFELLTGKPNHVRAVGGDQRVMVVRPTAQTVAPHVLDGALHTALRGLGSWRCTSTYDCGYVLLRSVLPERELQTLLSTAVQQASALADVELCAALSPEGLAPADARATAERALDAIAVPHRCLLLRDCTPYLVLPQLLAQVQASALCDEASAALEDTLAITLLGWLNHLGDAAAAAEAQGVHRNTFRYRLQRAKDLVGIDLDDPVTRVVLHLQLMDRCGTGTSIAATP